jgi:enoyl-CoA hydratase/carnithine racemase
VVVRASAVEVVDLHELTTLTTSGVRERTAAITSDRDRIWIGTAHHGDLAAIQPIVEALDLIVGSDDATATTPRPIVAVPEITVAVDRLLSAIEAAPLAALAVIELLRHSLRRSAWDALYAESIAYSQLLAGAEFRAWRAATPQQAETEPTEPAVITDRDGARLTVTLNRPGRRNAMSRWVRDATCDALDIALLDPTIREVRLTGNGPAFCSGGDLDEFGTQPDVMAAHFVRLDRSVGWRIHLLADRIAVDVHGACVGAGVELPAFAHRVVARSDAWFQLPELAMGLLPGACGTVSIPRRIGRWRAAWLALSGERLDVETAHRWGLVDRVEI